MQEGERTWMGKRKRWCIRWNSFASLFWNARSFILCKPPVVSQLDTKFIRKPLKQSQNWPQSSPSIHSKSIFIKSEVVEKANFPCPFPVVQLLTQSVTTGELEIYDIRKIKHILSSEDCSRECNYTSTVLSLLSLFSLLYLPYSSSFLHYYISYTCSAKLKWCFDNGHTMNI